MMTVIKCFSVLIASGNGARCVALRNVIRDQLLTVEPISGELKVMIHKYGKVSYPEKYLQISKEIAREISPLFADIDKCYFGSDNQ